uniref:Uncharacterized protein n=1 Tax=Brassica campestris TaxID=3711 RepID=A0A3P6B6U2_BRACM|nr:unnamed protein product [Brassica rapa]
MPRNRVAWSAWNFLTSSENKASLTHWLNIIQNLDEEHDSYFLTLNPEVSPKKTLYKWTSGRPLPSVSAWKASQELNKIQGKRGIWFCGAYQVRWSILTEYGLVRKQCQSLARPTRFKIKLIELSNPNPCEYSFGSFYNFAGSGFHEDGLKASIISIK